MKKPSLIRRTLRVAGFVAAVSRQLYAGRTWLDIGQNIDQNKPLILTNTIQQISRPFLIWEKHHALIAAGIDEALQALFSAVSSSKSSQLRIHLYVFEKRPSTTIISISTMVKVLRNRSRQESGFVKRASAGFRRLESRKSRWASTTTENPEVVLPSPLECELTPSSHADRLSSEELSDIAPEIVVWTEDMDVEMSIHDEATAEPSNNEWVIQPTYLH
jgi:hypothetical protein